MNLIPVTRPWMGQEEEVAAVEAIRSGWVMAGPRVAQFEADFADTVSAPHACAVHSCTAGLRLALRALGVQAGDVVVTVSHSFIATANAIRLVGAEPVFVDIDPATLNLDPKALEACLNSQFDARDGSFWFGDIERIAAGESPLARCAEPRGRLAAIIVVHQVGMPADMQAILAVAKRYGVPVVEDAACAIGSQHSSDGGSTWIDIGSPLGDMVCFSFHPRKVITTGEGGMITTADAELDRQVRIWRQHGMDRSPADRESGEPSNRETYVSTANNDRMTDIQAAIGIEQLKRLPEITKRRRAIAARYLEELRNVDGLLLSVEPGYARSNYQSFVVTLSDPSRTTAIMKHLKENGVDSRPGIMCSHLEPPYQQAWPQGSLPHSERARDGGIILPLYPTMDDDAPDRVMDTLRQALQVS